MYGTKVVGAGTSPCLQIRCHSTASGHPLAEALSSSYSSYSSLSFSPNPSGQTHHTCHGEAPSPHPPRSWSRPLLSCKSISSAVGAATISPPALPSDSARRASSKPACSSCPANETSNDHVLGCLRAPSQHEAAETASSIIGRSNRLNASKKVARTAS